LDLQDRYGKTAILKIFGNNAIRLKNDKLKYIKILLEKDTNAYIEENRDFNLFNYIEKETLKFVEQIMNERRIEKDLNEIKLKLSMRIKEL